jgi:hypothetical protein
MANEAVLLFQFMPPVDFTCADATGIEKGTLLKLSDPMTVAATSADNDLFIGIAAEEKIASDGHTKIPVHIMGIARMKDSGSGATVGTDVVIAGANTVKTYSTLDDEKGYVVGKILETTSASDTGLVLFGLR